MSEMLRDSIPQMKLEGQKRGMSYGQYVAAAYYPVIVIEPVAGGESLVHRMEVPPVLPGWEDEKRSLGSEAGDGQSRTVRREKKSGSRGTGRKCAVCGEELGLWQRLYCGEVCKKRASSKRYYQRKKAGEIKLPPKLVYEPRECAACGQQFEPISRNQKYCGTECGKRALREGNKLRWEAEKAMLPKKKCIACGAELVGRQIKYCAGCAIKERNRQWREHDRARRMKKAGTDGAQAGE